MINYIITPDVNSHIYNVKLSFVAKQAKHLLKLPVWIPGSYMIREFSKNIVSIGAFNPEYQLSQLDKNTWELSELTPGANVNVSYNVYAYEFGIRTAFLDVNRGYFNNTSLCLSVDGQENCPHIITLNQLPENWHIATGLSQIGINQFRADNYDELIDCPVELGDFTRLEFYVKGIPHYFILSGTIPKYFDDKRLIADVVKICQTEIDLFGGIPPFKDYTFILYLGGEIYTGLEHRNSTLLLAPYYSLPVMSQSAISDDYLKLLGLISHEFFHTWNVKRIKPQVFNPYNLNNENYTHLLWWFEGITSYYDDLILHKSGLIDNKRYLQIVTDNINNVYKYAGVKNQTLTNSSMTAWIKYYRPDDNSPNALVSYYVKGSLVGLCLDLLIRSKTISKSLDDVLLGLFNKWQHDGLGIMEDELPKLIQEYTGCDLRDEINQFINTVENLPLDELLSQFGVLVHTAINQRQSDTGKIIKEASELPTMPKFDLGCKLAKDALGYKILYVYDDTIAQTAGLAANDIIIAIDAIKLTDFEKLIALYNVGSEITLTLFRQERLISVKLTLESPNFNIRYLQITDTHKLAKWLG
jgi:predicted metalloprotease with PDZ domain